MMLLKKDDAIKKIMKRTEEEADLKFESLPDKGSKLKHSWMLGWSLGRIETILKVVPLEVLSLIDERSLHYLDKTKEKIAVKEVDNEDILSQRHGW